MLVHKHLSRTNYFHFESTLTRDLTYRSLLYLKNLSHILRGYNYRPSALSRSYNIRLIIKLLWRLWNFILAGAWRTNKNSTIEARRRGIQILNSPAAWTCTSRSSGKERHEFQFSEYPLDARSHHSSPSFAYRVDISSRNTLEVKFKASSSLEPLASRKLQSEQKRIKEPRR